MVAGVLIGHGSYDGPETVVVPDGLTVHFFVDEGTSMTIVNLLALLQPDNPRIPMHFAMPGKSVPNYRYAPFKEHERRAITALNRYPAPAIVVGSAETPDTLRLCANPGGCPPQGPHTCAGVFGRAARAGWSYLLVFSCRFDVRRELPPTLDLMKPHGVRDRSVQQALVDWVQRFVGLGKDEQDDLWNGLHPDERLRLVASDDEVREWDACRELRVAMTTATNPAAVAAGAPDAVKVRLIRDYPRHRAAVRAGLHRDPADAQDIEAFLSLPFDDRVGWWLDLTVHEQARWMANDEVTHWAAGFNACELFSYGLRGENLLGLLSGLELPALAVAKMEPKLTEHLTLNSMHV